MKVTLDLETNVITVPKNFFTNIAKENEIIEKNGGKAVPVEERLRKPFEAALANTDKYLIAKK
jgi:hypothetical protein